MVALLLVSHLLNGGGEDLGSRCIGRLASKTVSKRWENNGGRICGGLGFGGNVSRWNLRCWVDRCLNVF